MRRYLISGRTEGKRHKTVIDMLDRSRVQVVELPEGAYNLLPTWSRGYIGDKPFYYYGYTYDLEN